MHVIWRTSSEKVNSKGQFVRNKNGNKYLEVKVNYTGLTSLACQIIEKSNDTNTIVLKYGRKDEG